MAVDSFFILSGFLIVNSWHSRPHTFTFLSSRILRIYPGFITASLVCAFIVGPLYGAPDYYQKFDWKTFFFNLIQLKLAGAPVVFPGSPYPVLNGAMWSIPYEFKCYLLVLFFGITALFKKEWAWPMLLIASTVVHIINRTSSTNIPLDIYFRCLMTFSSGGCFYLYQRHIKWSNKYAWIALLLLVLSLPLKALAEPALCVFWGYAILYYAKNGKALLGFNRLPDMSYGIYLYAWPINKIILWHYPNANTAIAVIAVFALSIVCGAISWYCVEKPFMKLKKVFRKAQTRSGEHPLQVRH